MDRPVSLPYFAAVVSFLTTCLLTPCWALAETHGKISVYVGAAKGTPVWKAKAIEGTILQNLSGFDRIQVGESIRPKEVGCALSDSECVAREARKRGIDILLLGVVDGQSVTLETYETWTRTLAQYADIKLGDKMTLTEFRHRVFRLVRPFVEIGGYFDQQGAQLTKEKEAAQAAKAAAEFAPAQLVLQMFAACILIFLFWVPREFVRRIARVYKVGLAETAHGQRLIFALSFILPISWLMATYPGSYAELMPRTIAEAFPWLKYIMGGAAWASVLLIYQRFALPPIHTMERLTFFTILPLLRAWTAVSLSKSLLFAGALSPFILGSLWLSHLANYDPVMACAVWLPIAILLGILWYLLWIECFTLFIDTQLVVEPATGRNPWHGEIRHYFEGYLNRLGVSIDERLLSRALFLPAKQDCIVSYGGGLVPPRVVLSSWMLMYAMGTLVEKDPEVPKSTGFPDFRSGMILPRRRGVGQGDDDGGGWKIRFPFLKTAEKKREMRLQAEKTFNLHNATILGYITPAPPEETVGLVANNREDFNVVAELLTEHYSRFATDPEERELDDTDATDKDFLFGALLREHGVLEHRDQLVLTFYLGLSLGFRAFPEWIMDLIESLRRIYDARFSRYPNMIADAYAALNGGRNHLIQYLFYMMSDQRRILTARADSSTLYAVARQILLGIRAQELTPEDGKTRQATFRNRMDWMSWLFFGSGRVIPTRFKIPLRVGAAILAIGIFRAYIVDAWQYHPIYEQRVQRMKQRIEEQNQRKQERENVGK